MLIDLIFLDYSNEKLFSRKALDPSNQNVDGPATNIPGQQDVSPRKIGPNPVEPTNILLQQFPPPLSFEGREFSNLLFVSLLIKYV